MNQLQELRAKLRTVLGLPSSSGVTDTTLDEYINQSYRYNIPLMISPPALTSVFYMTTANGTERYGIDPDMLSVQGPVYVEELPIYWTFDYIWYFDYTKNKDTEDKAKPTVALFFSHQLYLYPVPDDNYEVETVALARPTALSADTDIVTNAAWSHAIVYDAARTFAQERGDSDLAALAHGLMEQAITNAKREELLHYTNRRAVPSV